MRGRRFGHFRLTSSVVAQCSAATVRSALGGRPAAIARPRKESFAVCQWPRALCQIVYRYLQVMLLHPANATVWAAVRHIASECSGNSRRRDAAPAALSVCALALRELTGVSSMSLGLDSARPCRAACGRPLPVLCRRGAVAARAWWVCCVCHEQNVGLTMEVACWPVSPPPLMPTWAMLVAGGYGRQRPSVLPALFLDPNHSCRWPYYILLSPPLSTISCPLRALSCMGSCGP